MSYLFPLAVLVNTLSMTALLIGVSLAGHPVLAADIGIVQAVTVALFYAFSANARSLVLNPDARVSVGSLLATRLILIVPLGAVAWYLSVHLTQVQWSLALALILRRAVEWIGELHLGEMELRGHRTLAGQYLVLQILPLLLLLGWTFSDASLPLPGLLLWSVLPLLIGMGFIRRHLVSGNQLTREWPQMLPHLGSSSVIGITVYVFRLLILIIAGKVIAGDLYAAFAIGGMLNTVYTLGLGPSLLFHEQKTGREHQPEWLQVVIMLVTLAGLAVTATITLVPGQQDWAGKDMIFWQALGLSLIGGTVFLLAQRQRLRDIQNGTEDDIFGPDVLANILMVAGIPFLNYAFGSNGLACLYLLNSFMALVVYWMADIRRTVSGMAAYCHGNWFKAVLAVLLVIPVFLNLETGLFRSTQFLYDSGGVLSRLPIPLSVFGCYAGIVLMGNYRRANLGLAVIFGSFVLMVLSTVAMTYNHPYEEQAKFTLLMQYILPMFGLVLGMMYEGGSENGHLIEKSVLVVIAVLMLVQLPSSWVQGQMFLAPYLYVFSIYQHLQYVPVIVVSSYLLSLFSLWDSTAWRGLLLALAPLIGIYAAASGSMLTAGFVSSGCATFAIHRMVMGRCRGRCIAEWAVCVLVLGGGTAYQFWSSWTTTFIGAAEQPGAGWAGTYTQKLDDGGAPLNLQSRVSAWQYYLNGIGSDLSTFLLGHNMPPDRKLWPSAHNYYLDFIYNFGFVSAFVIIGLVFYTVLQLYRRRAFILSSPAMSGLAIVVLFLLIPDSLLKVGMRQPYPGIITFFLWGVLLARLQSLHAVSAKLPTRLGCDNS